MGEMKAGPALWKFMAETDTPVEFQKLFEHCLALRFEESPDYDMLRGLFRGRMAREGWSHDWKFDWMDPDLCEGGTLLPAEYEMDERFVDEGARRQALYHM